MDKPLTQNIEDRMREFTDKLTEGSEQELMALAGEIDTLLKLQGQLPTTTRVLKQLGAQGFKALLEARLQAPAVKQALQEANEKLQAELNANFVIDKQAALAQLLEALEKGAVGPTPPVTVAQLKIDEIDTTSWTEFREGFFDKPLIKSVLWQGKLAGTEHNSVMPCGYLSVISVDKEKAIEALRQELLVLGNSIGVVVTGFLAKPSVIELVRLAKPDETPDVPVVVDLKGHQPGKRIWTAFCFVHGYIVKPFTVDSMREMGISGATLEGEAGVEIK